MTKSMALSPLLTEAKPPVSHTDSARRSGTGRPRRRITVEVTLTHVVRHKVEAAYARSDLFERRRELTNDWEAYLNRQRPDAPPQR